MIYIKKTWAQLVILCVILELKTDAQGRVVCALACVWAHAWIWVGGLYLSSHTVPFWYQLYSKSQRESTLTSDRNNWLTAADRQGRSVTITFSSMTMNSSLTEYKWLIRCPRLLICVLLANMWLTFPPSSSSLPCSKRDHCQENVMFTWTALSIHKNTVIFVMNTQIQFNVAHLHFQFLIRAINEIYNDFKGSMRGLFSVSWRDAWPYHNQTLT